MLKKVMHPYQSNMGAIQDARRRAEIRNAVAQRREELLFELKVVNFSDVHISTTEIPKIAPRYKRKLVNTKISVFHDRPTELTFVAVSEKIRNDLASPKFSKTTECLDLSITSGRLDILFVHKRNNILYYRNLLTKMVLEVLELAAR